MHTIAPIVSLIISIEKHIHHTGLRSLFRNLFTGGHDYEQVRVDIDELESTEAVASGRSGPNLSVAQLPELATIPNVDPESWLVRLPRIARLPTGVKDLYTGVMI